MGNCVYCAGRSSRASDVFSFAIIMWEVRNVAYYNTNSMCITFDMMLAHHDEAEALPGIINFDNGTITSINTTTTTTTTTL
jgi:hypothetical protein